MVAGNRINFLPNSFKITGSVFCIVMIITEAVARGGYINLNQSESEIVKTLTFNLFILGLSLIAIAKDKDETEDTIAIKLRAIIITFKWVIFYIVFIPIGNLVFGDVVEPISGQWVIVTLLLGYLIIYYFLKNGRR